MYPHGQDGSQQAHPQQPSPHPPQHGYPYGYQQGYGQVYGQVPPPPVAPPVFPQSATTKTRRIFNHSAHIKWTVLTLGVWGVTGYPIAWAWNRFGPEKSVSTTRFHY